MLFGSVSLAVYQIVLTGPLPLAVYFNELNISTALLHFTDTSFLSSTTKTTFPGGIAAHYCLFIIKHTGVAAQLDRITIDKSLDRDLHTTHPLLGSRGSTKAFVTPLFSVLVLHEESKDHPPLSDHSRSEMCVCVCVCVVDEEEGNIV